MQSFNYLIDNDVYFYLNAKKNKISFAEFDVQQRNKRYSSKKFKLSFKNNKIMIQKQNQIRNLLIDSFWEVNDINGCQQKNSLKKDTVIRFGSRIFQVVHLNSAKKIKLSKQLLTNSQCFFTKTSVQQSLCVDQQNCRICFQKETEENCFARNFCQCSKSNPQHLSCLKQYLQSKILQQNKESQTVISFNYADIKCELCLQEYPIYYRQNDQKKKLVEFEMQEENSYVILDELNASSNKLISSFLLNFDSKKVLSVGRNKGNDMIIEGETISRDHAAFQYKQDKFYLLDRQSTFGTYFLKSNLIQLDQHSSFVIDKFKLNCHIVDDSLKNCACKKLDFCFDKKKCYQISQSQRKNNSKIKKKKRHKEKQDQEQSLLKNFQIFLNFLNSKDKSEIIINSEKINSAINKCTNLLI